MGGEHEDYYDPDFYIYNDVVIFAPADLIEIYGYPKEVFPPTDFHTACLLGSQLIIIGGLGYPADRRPGYTPVYALDLAGHRIVKMESSGENPGWIFEHDAEVDAQGTVIIQGGQVVEERNGNQRFRRNFDQYALNSQTWTWRRLTNKKWRQFSIHQEDGDLFVLQNHPEHEMLFPGSIEHTAQPCEDSDRIRFLVCGVPISVIVGVSDIEIIVEGELPGDLAGRVAEEVRANAEAAIQRRCLLDLA